MIRVGAGRKLAISRSSSSTTVRRNSDSSEVCTIDILSRLGNPAASRSLRVRPCAALVARLAGIFSVPDVPAPISAQCTPAPNGRAMPAQAEVRSPPATLRRPRATNEQIGRSSPRQGNKSAHYRDRNKPGRTSSAGTGHAATRGLIRPRYAAGVVVAFPLGQRKDDEICGSQPVVARPGQARPKRGTCALRADITGAVQLCRQLTKNG